jgi:hypothetical protein
VLDLHLAITWSNRDAGLAAAFWGGGRLRKSVMNHPGFTFSRDASVWIQTRLSGTGLS